MKNKVPFFAGALLLATLFSCAGKSPQSDIKFRQYYLKGEQLYKQHCANCHQGNGKGFGLLYPPLDSSDFLLNFPDSALCIIRHGRSGPLSVNGKTYNQPMPASPTLTDIEIAELMTYITNSWSNEKGIFEVRKVTEILSGCGN